MVKRDAHDWVVDLEIDEIREMIANTFAFLVSDYGFQPPEDSGISTIVIALTYRGEKIAIRPLVDRKDRAVETCVVRLECGVSPKGRKADQHGQQIMTRLFEAVWDRGLKIPRRSTSEAETAREALQEFLDWEVMLLREGFADFLADDDSYFTCLNLRNARRAAVEAEKEFLARAEGFFKAKNYARLVDLLDKPDYELSELWEARLSYARKHV